MEKKRKRLYKIEKQGEQKDEKNTDFTIYYPLKNGKGKYECIPYSFYGTLTSFSENIDLINFLRNCFYSEEECEEWIKKQGEQKSSWSEIDEIGYNDAIFAIEKAMLVAKDENDMGNLWFAEKWLKTLKGNRVAKKKIEKQDESNDGRIRKELIEYIKGQKITPNHSIIDN